jgi:hypothetical protein
VELEPVVPAPAAAVLPLVVVSALASVQSLSSASREFALVEELLAAAPVPEPSVPPVEAPASVPLDAPPLLPPVLPESFEPLAWANAPEARARVKAVVVRSFVNILFLRGCRAFGLLLITAIKLPAAKIVPANVDCSYQSAVGCPEWMPDCHTGDDRYFMPRNSPAS